MRKLSFVGLTFLLLVPSQSQAGSITKSHTFTSGGTASASQINTNFDQLFTEINAKEIRIISLEGGGTISPWTIGAGLIHYTGSVGIGTATPEGILDVRGLISAGSVATQINNPNAIAVLRSAGNPHLILEKAGQSVGGLALDSTDIVMGAELGDIVFRTGLNFNGDFTSTGNERMRLNASGDLGLNTNSPQAKLHIVPTENGGRGLILDKFDNAEGGELLINGNTKSWNIDNAWGSLRFSRFGANLGGFESVSLVVDDSDNLIINAGGSLMFGGSSVCTSAGCSAAPSDLRLKENIQPLENSLARVLRLKGVSYDWRDRELYRQGSRIGFIAQELEENFPEVVFTDEKTKMKSVSYGHLIAPVVEAIKAIFHSLSGTQAEVKKLKAENEELKARVEKSEREFASLKSRIDKLENSRP